MRVLLSAVAVVAALTGAASAEPVKLDEANLGGIAAGIVDIGINTTIDVPTAVNNDLDVTNQIGTAVGINTTAVTAVFSSTVSGVGAAAGAANFNAGSSVIP
jgi:hypothetical protein